MDNPGSATKFIRLPAPHPRFRPRVEGGVRSPGHPGAAVRIGKDLFEVAAAEKSGDEWVYRLEPWPENEVIRAYVEWGEGAEREFIGGLREERARARKSRLIWGAQAFLGFLPARRQERLKQTIGLNPARATFWSAALETLVALPFAFSFVITIFAGAAGSLVGFVPTWAGILASAVTAEGVLRLIAVISSGEPIGSLFLILLDFRWKSEGPPRVPGDEILALEGRLDVISLVRKAWWERAGGVTYRGEPFILTESKRERTRYTYRFRRGGEGFPVLDPELEKVRNRSSDSSYVLAILWGFLPANLQKGLEFYGRYRPRPYVLISIGFNFLLALAFVGPGLKDLSRGAFNIGSLALLAAAVALFAESLVRLVRLVMDGRISGSFLAFLVKPVYGLTITDKTPGQPD